MRGAIAVGNLDRPRDHLLRQLIVGRAERRHDLWDVRAGRILRDHEAAGREQVACAATPQLRVEAHDHHRRSIPVFGLERAQVAAQRIVGREMIVVGGDGRPSFGAPQSTKGRFQQTNRTITTAEREREPIDGLIWTMPSNPI